MGSHRLKSIHSISPAVDSTMSLAVVLAVVAMMAALATAHPAQHKLHQELLTSYNPLFIPMLNTSDVQRVIMKASLRKIMDVDQEKGVLTTLLWLDLSWDDDYLRWDPEEYSGLSRLELPPSKVWTPDIFLFNDATGRFSADMAMDSPWLVVTSEGHVRWIPPLVVKPMCDFTTDWKTGVQPCELKFGSWVNNSARLDLINTIDRMDLAGYTGNRRWKLDSTAAERHETFYDCCPESFMDLTYTINIAPKQSWFQG